MTTATKLSLVTAACLLAACGGTPSTTSERHSVCLTRPEALTPQKTRSYSGVVKAAHEIGLGFKTAGQIARIHVREGDYVRQGQLLAELDDADYRLAVEALQIQYDQLEDEVKRTSQLFEQKSVSANDFEKASAGLHQLGVQLRINKNKLDYTKLYAPADGYIRSVGFSAAEMVDAGTSVMTLLDASPLEVSVDIPVEEYQRRGSVIRYNCRASGIAAAMPLRFLSVAPKADGNQLYTLELAFTDRPDATLTAGMNVEVEIVSADSTAAHGHTVPLRALFNDGQNACVWVMQGDSTVVKRPVTIDGSLDNSRAVVTDGLTGDELIVRAGVNVLQQGEKVKVVEEPSKTNIGGIL